MCERTIAEYEEELCPTKEEKERQYQLLDAVFKKHQVVLHRTEVQQPPYIKEEALYPPCVKEEEPKPHIKEEEEEVWIRQEGECLLGQEEADLTKFPLTVVSVKTEDHEDKPPESSQLYHSPNVCEEHLLPEQQEGTFKREQEEPQPHHIKEGQAEPQHSHIKVEIDKHSISQFPVIGVIVKSEVDEVKGESEEKREVEPLSSSSTQHMTTEADGDHCGGSQAGKLLAPLSDSDDTTSHSPDTDDEDSKAEKTCHTDNTHFTCPYCDKTFNHRFSLKRHTRRHTGEKLFSCSICAKGFIQNTDLEKHMRIHTGEKPFMCSICSKRFSQKANLIIHKRIHTGEKPFNAQSVVNVSYKIKI
ncbi:zinc finger protein 3-like isoform X1 [Entelurus aequoreus]|uniref:zinc finger protein 3-like isoform X1 n=1 Tax=Entelurus aequoreus TaxID=161455 RepID=UPI002B1E299B|nr:zinc finger protein 3-like isoform X1 [Entelurus aequoreus]